MAKIELMPKLYCSLEFVPMFRVLLVEDNRIFRKMFKEILRQHFPSMLIEEAQTGKDAIDKLGGDPSPPTPPSSAWAAPVGHIGIAGAAREKT